ncbi:MAG: MucR family transcriptional regulator [Holosporales bacterium]|nr:MucR family transcriptional regulator [Holosporales bacterium]
MVEFDVLTRKDLMELATRLACSYMSANSVKVEEVGSLVNLFFQSLLSFNKTSFATKNRGPVVPAVPIEESVFDDYIVCLEDGKRLQMLKRHLSTVYKMSLDEYKERWGLGPDYPVVAPSYARRRSSIARNTGLGKTGRRKIRVVDSAAGSAAVA